jgi:hypothetical protein
MRSNQLDLAGNRRFVAPNPIVNRAALQTERKPTPNQALAIAAHRREGPSLLAFSLSERVHRLRTVVRR